jgi:hypothetical protein
LSYCEHFLDLIERDKISKDTEDVWGRFPSSAGGESVPGQSPNGQKVITRTGSLLQ